MRILIFKIDAGYQEVVDFGEVIGEHVKESGERVWTTRGKIHYDKNGGAHIVPAPPNQ